VTGALECAIHSEIYPMTNRANRWPFLAAALLISIMAGGWAATHWNWVAGYLLPAAPPGASEAAALPVIPVTVVSAKMGSVPRIIAGIGIVSALQSVTVRSRIDGEVMEISFAEGQFVKAGDVLAQIDPRQLEAALAGAEAKKAQDTSQLDTAQSDSERYATLAQKNIVSSQTLDLKVAAVKQLEAAIASDDAAISSARTQLSYATIRAPISGRTGFRSVDKGGLIGQNASVGLVTITQLDPIGVVFVAPGDRFGEIRDALKAGIADVEALSTDGAKVLARGKLTLMDNAVDALNGSIKLKATFDNKDNALWPGLPVATRLTIAMEKGVVVPDKALARNVDGLTAYLVGADDKVARRPVSASVITDGFALITKGLSDGDRIVYDGLGQIVDGANVAVGPPPLVAPPAFAAQPQSTAPTP
jgi:multidrug efflux system membrane fusion protein